MLLTDINSLLDVKGYAFDEKDLSAIQDSLTRSEAEFEEVSKLKEDLEARLQETSARYAHLQSTIADFKTALRFNPIRVLMPEILSYVFLEYCGVHSAQLPSSLSSNANLCSTFDDISHRRHVLLSVCRRWRAITLGTPRLWAAIDLSGPYVIGPKRLRYFHNRSTPHLPPDVIDQHWQRIDQAVQRASSVPLSIVQSLASRMRYQGMALRDADVYTMLRRLVNVLPHTQDVNLQFDQLEPTMLPALSDYPECWPHTPMPHLKTVRIASHSAMPDMSQWLRDFFRQVPRKQLVEVELSCGRNDEVFVENILIMTDVKRLSLPSTSLLSIKSLKSTPLLEKLTLTQTNLPSGGPPPVPECLPRLSFLKIHDISSGIETTLSWLTLPSLQHLKISIVLQNSREIFPFSSLPNFFERSQCRLQSLDIKENTTISPSVLLDILRLQEHSLTSLSLLKGSLGEINQSILDFLIGAPAQVPLPLLRCLELRVSPDQVASLSRLLQHRFPLVSQSSQVTHLDFFRVYVESPSPSIRSSLDFASLQKHKDMIQPYIDAGLEIKMDYSQNY